LRNELDATTGFTVMILEIFFLAIQLGLPLALLSWLLFMRLFLSGEVDRGAGRKEIDKSIKTLKENFTIKQKQDRRSFMQKSKTDLVFEKWMYFGSGFYGLATCWTFLVIEASELISFIVNYSGIPSHFQDGIIPLLVGLLLGQLGNLLSAFFWFGYWGESVVLSVLVAYSGYWIGIEAARRNLDISTDAFLTQIKWKRKESPNG
jgi:hypothetical protein